MSAPLFELLKADNVPAIRALVAATKPEERAALFAVEPVSKETPLHTAVSLKNPGMVAALLDLGHPTEALDGEGWSVLHSAIMRRCSADIVSALVARKELVNMPATNGVYSGYTPLHCAAFQKDEASTRLLLAAGADPSIVAGLKETPLHVAASAGSCVELLLKGGAPVNAGNKLGVTPLMEAAAKERLLSVELILTHPALNLAQTDNNGDTAMHHAFNVQLQKLFGENWPVREDAQRIAYLLACSGSPIDVPNAGGVSPLKYASKSFALILRNVSANRKLAEALPTLDHALQPAAGAALSGMLSDADLKAFSGAAAIVKHEMENVMAEENAKGACPFLNARKPKRNTEDVADEDFESDESGGEEDLDALAKKATPEQVSACPFLQSKQAAKADAADAKASGGSCPIPFHRQLVNPYVWLGAAALFALSIAVTKYRSRSSSSA